VMRYAQDVTRNVRVSDEVFDAVHSFLDDKQMVELALTGKGRSLVADFGPCSSVEVGAWPCIGTN